MSGPAVRRGTFVAEVVANERICDEHYLLGLSLGAFPLTRPGQFVQLQCRGLGEQAGASLVDWPPGRLPALTQPELTESQPLLRRPFSLAGRRDRDGGGVELDIIYRVIGAGTHWLAGVQAGMELSVLGPLGNEFAIRQAKPQAALVGGGVGIPPMLYLAEALAEAGKSTVALCGARSANLLPLTLSPNVAPSPAEPTLCAEQFARTGTAAVIATDDGTAGFRGLVSEAFEHWLDATAPPAGELVVYCCGPEEMMKSVGLLCIARGIECQLALERHMACGMGTCQSCIVKIRDSGEQGWSYKLCCTDGPVFDARDVIWV